MPGRTHAFLCSIGLQVVVIIMPKRIVNKDNSSVFSLILHARITPDIHHRRQKKRKQVLLSPSNIIFLPGTFFIFPEFRQDGSCSVLLPFSIFSILSSHVLFFCAVYHSFFFRKTWYVYVFEVQKYFQIIFAFRNKWMYLYFVPVTNVLCIIKCL